jgi:soluble lytic murein transglycosylase-like protein
MQNSGANPKIQAKTLEAAEQQASAFDSNLVSLPLGKNASGTSKGDYSTYVSSAGGQRGYDSKGNLLYDSNQGGVIRQAAYTENDIDPVLAKIRLFRPKATAQSVANMLGRMQEVSPLVNKYAKMYGLDPALLYAAIYCESSAVHNTKNGILTSSAGALGLMQVMPGTFEFLQAKNPSLDNIRDLEQNLHAGAMYLRMMLNRYSGKTRNVDGQISFNWGFTAAVMAYNGGPGTVDDFINHGASLPKETREYLQRVTAAYSLFATMKIERIEHMDLKIFVDEARDSVKAFSSGWHFG